MREDLVWRCATKVFSQLWLRRTSGSLVKAELKTELTTPLASIAENLAAFITHPPPPVPYVKGRQIVIRSHNPPPPERYKTRCCALKGESKVEQPEVSPLERCLRHPPPIGSFNDAWVEFEIVDEKRAGLNHSAQVLTIKILQAPPAFVETLGNSATVVAKLYDPLYYNHEESDGDPFICVNRHDTHETATYNRLADLQGTVVPNFYGSYSLELPVDHPLAKSRSVRLILMEHIHASSMRELSPEGFSQSERQRIMKHVIDGETAIHTRDIMLTDLSPRYVLVEYDEHGSWRNIKRVVLIDFGQNMMSRFWWVGYRPEMKKTRLPGVFISPLVRWHIHSGMTTDFYEWIDWDYQNWLEVEYAHSLSSVTPKIITTYLPKGDCQFLDPRTIKMFGLEGTFECRSFPGLL